MKIYVSTRLLFRVLCASLVMPFAASSAGDPASFIGINCGKSGAHDDKAGIEQFFLKRNIATLNLARELGLGWARCGGGPEQWHAGGRPSPERFEMVVEHANELGIKVYLFIEYRGDINSEAITDFDWQEVGKSFASFFGDRVACYGILNEVDHVASPHSPEEIAAAVSSFADGVRSVDQNLAVISPSLGGTPMKIDRADEFLRAIEPLINSGKIDILNLHSYHDSRPDRPHYSNIDHSSEWAPSRNFLRAKQVAGITRNVRFAAGEFNYRNWHGEDADRAIGFMTTLWDQLMVVADLEKQERTGVFSIPYNIPDAREGRQTTMSKRFEWSEDGSFDWEPNEKGRVLKENLNATSGMEFILCDPHNKGIAILKGDGRKAWVWQNRKAFSDLVGRRTISITGIGSDAKTLKLLTHDSTVERPFRTYELQSQTEIVLQTADLPAEQTLIFLTDSDRGNTPGSILGQE